MGNVSVPQYSEVYGQVQTVSEKPENNNSELSKNIQLSPKISVFIGDTEIKDFVISAIDEANAVSVQLRKVNSQREKLTKSSQSEKEHSKADLHRKVKV